MQRRELAPRHPASRVAQNLPPAPRDAEAGDRQQEDEPMPKRGAIELVEKAGIDVGVLLDTLIRNAAAD